HNHAADLAAIDPHAQPLATGQRFVQARWLGNQRVAALGPPAWKVYRDRVEGIAKKRLDEAGGLRDVPGLRRVVEDTFCSRAAEKALEMLGDLAFEGGRFAEAQYWWRLLTAPASVDPDRPVALGFPDPAPDVVA